MILFIYNLLMQYPCKLPKIQIDTWGQTPSNASCSAEKLAALLFTKYHMLVAISLLHCNRAVTISAIAKSIHQIRQGIQQATLRDGQIYIQPHWRVRWDHMTEELQRMVCKHDVNVTAAFEAQYNARQLEDCIMSIIGPARSAGVKCYLQWKYPCGRQPTLHPA